MKYEDVYSPDTVGVVVLDKSSVFAVATSTGGASPMMMGRVGDTPMVGCGFYAGERGAVAVTGIGEEAVRRMSAKTVYEISHNCCHNVFVAIYDRWFLFWGR